jgi:uncharacterized protein YerC
MVRVNKHQLSEKQLYTLYGQFDEIQSSLSQVETSDFLNELLGPEERMVIAKRLLIIVLLLEGKTLYFIADQLHISPATAAKIKNRLDNGAYDSIVRSLGKNKRKYGAILDTIDSMLHLGGILPHYNGIDRYRFR